MEEAWLAAKCGSRWPPSLPASSPARPLPPPPATLAPLASSLGTANSMGLDSHKFRHPFIRQINIGDSAIVQEPKIFNTLNLDSCKSGKAELGSSFLSLLSGSAHPASSKFLQLPYSGSELAKFHVREGGVVNGPRCDVPVTSISPISESRVIENGEDFPFVASRPLSMSTCTNFPLLQNNFQAATSSCHSTRFGKTVPRQAFPGNNAGTKVSSRKHEWPIASSPSNANQQSISNQTTEKMPSEARPSNRSHSSTTFRGRPHVFCMNKVGELFVSDMGLLGVLCFCHKQPMSVAKFCEHSGFPSANPGEAVHLENGMTVAQWRKLCFGVMASDRSNEWEWSDGSSAEVGLVRPKFSSLPTSSKNSASINSFEAFSGLGKIGEPRNKTIFPNHTYGGLRGQIASEKSANKGTENVLQRNGLDRQNFSTKRFAGSAQSTIPALSKNHMAHAIKESPIRMGFEGSHLISNQGEQNVVPQLVANNISYVGEIGNHPISFPHSGMNNTFSCANHIHRGNFSGQTFVVDQDGSSSNIELRLGHPSQKNNTSPGSFPVAMHPFHLGSVCNLQKAQLHQPLAHTNAADYSKESKKPRLDLQCTLSEESPLNRRLHHSSGSNVFKHSEIEDPMGDATKSSLISFLSHLNTEGNSSSQSTDIIGNYNEYFGARVFDSASLYGKCNFSDFARDLIDGNEKKPDTNGSDLSNNIDQAKGLNIVDNGSYAVAKPNYVVHRKQPQDARVLSSATGGYCIYNSSSVDNRQPTLYFNQPSGMLQTAPNYRNSDKYAEVSLQGNRDRCSCTIHTSTSPIPNATARHCSHNSENLISFSSTNSMHISEPISALSNKKSADRTQNLRDESFISLPLRHMDELSKLELPTSSLETNTRCKRLCCLSDVGFLRNVCKDDLVATKELREAPYCIIQQDESSNVVKSTHSFSNCYSCCDVQMSSANADSTGPFKCCNCSASTQRLSCSKEHGIQFSTSHTCHAFEKPCLRLGRISNNSYPDSNKHEVCNHKEESSPISGKCCCTALPKYLTGCCFSGGDSLSGALSEHLCGKAKTMHVSPTYDRDDMLQDGRRVRLGQCECLRKHVVMKNDCQIALWRDVPNKVRGHSDAAANEKSAQVVQATRLVGDQLTDTAAKEIDGTHQESKSLNEQQMSNVSSGSSAAAITEISVEVNNMVSITTDAGNSKIVCDSMVNEGSRIEKCGSSDEALDNRESEEAINFTDRVKPINSSGNLTNELRLDGSSNFRRPRNQISVGCTDQENISQIHQFEPVCRVGKRKGPMKQSRIDASVSKLGFASLYSDSPEHVSHSLHQPPPQELDTSHQSDNTMPKMRVYTGRSPSFKRKRSALSSTKPFYLKRFKKHHKVSECDKVQSIYNDHSHRKQKVSAGKKAKQNLARDGKNKFTKEKEKLGDAGRPPKFMSLSCIGSSLNHGMDTSSKKVRPVVCSNSGIISSGAGDKQKPAKIVSLSLILKKASRCSITEHGGKPRLSCISGNKKTCLDTKIGCHNAISTWKLQCENEDSSVVIRNGMDPSNLVSSKIKKISTKNEKCPYEISIMKRDADYGYDEALESALHHEIAISGSKSRCKETREDEYLDLTESRNQLKTSPSTDIGDALVGNEHSTMKSCSKKVLNAATSANAKLLVISQNGQDHADEPREVNTRRCQSFISDLDAFCCVCGSSNKEDINQLLECNRCLIRVHQACYGISKVPKGRWCCRPCKTNSLNIVCVLCGYGGGAMTRALKSRNIVKSLLKAWKVGRGLNLINPAPSSNGIKSEFSEPGSVGEASEYDGSVHVVESISSETFPADASETDLTKTVTMSHSDSMPNNFHTSNSVTVGILDPSVTQWVHMVCGLWTPGTRCPNVDTMSAFDVSGASPARKITVCSMCNRPGGSCIQCRVMNCSVHFHPWCAHQKGLLQSEIEGDDNESVGFYGRCLLHATPSSSHIHSYPVGTEVDSSKNKDWTCARTEGFKGRKRDEGFNPNHHKPYNDGGGCIVSQEQINAWLHINGQKSCTRRAVKLPSSDIEYDVRKEYIRYKQSKAWKQLVVYKSGIHALGLYTSQFISRGAMVVEYVGEIVGLRIADKREIEYQSGRLLQYKSACYFFRIDKEHIIDATRKGGIARFVNHSCLPNCVAKVISVRNEKKVVFFAERDIYPGEEITYDYHFNHEDEGKKIPCFCNSKNCRRYLN